MNKIYPKVWYRHAISIILLLMFTVSACTPEEPSQIKHYPLDSLEGIITSTGVQLDSSITSDGNGSLHITANEPMTVRLYETGDIDIEDARLLYQAKVRTDSVEGNVYLEMWCHFPGKGESYSRGLQHALTGTQDWTTQETPFFLRSGENPDNVRLNLVIDGTGEAWIDDIRLIKGPL